MVNSNVADFIEPLGTRIVVGRHDALEQTDGGILLPEKARELPKEATVLAVGDEVKRLQIGDEILLDSQYTGHNVEIGGVKIVILEEDEVLVRLKKRG